MNKENCFELGYLGKSHGIRGNMHLILDVDDPLLYSNLKSVFIELGSNLVPYFIDDIQVGSNLNLIKFEGVDHVDSTVDLIGKKLYLPLKDLPKLQSNQFYFHEIIGYKVIDKKLGELGQVKEIVSLGSQDLLIMDYQHREVLIPLIDEIIYKVDKTQFMVYSTLPDGLLEIYLSDEN